ncbi:CMGC family protein kinase [Histomonas meleagridis]|uniref:CMGC family protein kinase n=1 Tax=Histomonas meleagridis TaxID=135588 RepID=UPI003559EB39|nr:CMGC family protein kinase [Histomonas meleagridis]KAH0798889.1 CMGC family protein kinase [Histomonas meleagridis]
MRRRKPLTNPDTPISCQSRDNCEGNLIVFEGEIYVLGPKIKLEFLSCAGMGAFGCVYEVRNLYNGKKYALKIGNSKCSKVIVNEAVIMSKISSLLNKSESRHVVQMYGPLKYCGHECILYELLSVNMYELIEFRKFTGLPIQYVQLYSRQICHALNSIHSINFVHLDIKPENILFTDSTFKEVKLTDFGNARVYDHNKISYCVTRYYRPPEIVLGLEFTNKSDVWSMGCLIAEILQGNPIFPGQNELHLLELMQKRVGKKIPKSLIKRSPRRKEFFNDRNELITEKEFCVNHKIQSKSSDIQSLHSKFFDWSIREFFDSVPDGNNPNVRNAINELYDLVTHMLEFEPEKRWSIADVMEHCFFKLSL